MDGVIIDSEPLHEKAQHIVFDRFDLSIPSAALQGYKGKTEQDVFGHIVALHPNINLVASELIAMKHQVYSELIVDLQLIPGAVPLIQALSSREIPLGLTTSATRRDQQRAFDLFGLDPYFEVTITADDITHPKPHPEPYLTTARQLEVDPKRCVVIEDSVHGIQAALRAGCTVVGLATSFEPDVLAKTGTHLVVRHFDTLASFTP